MHNRQIMFLSKAGCRGIFREHARPQERFESQMEQKVPFGPSWPAPDGTFCSIWKSARIRTGRPSQGRLLPVSPRGSVRGRAASAVRVRGTRTKRGPPFGGPLGRSGGEARIRTGGKGFAGLCLTTWPLRRRYEKGRFENRPDACDGADNGARTRDPNLGKVVLYQLSHVRLRVKFTRVIQKTQVLFSKKLPAACSWWLNALKRLARHAIPVLR